LHRVLTRFLLAPADIKAEAAESGTVMPIRHFVAAAILEHPVALSGAGRHRRRNAAGTVLVEVPAPIDRLLSGEQLLELKVGNGSAAPIRSLKQQSFIRTPVLAGLDEP
jgi:hypothetical protein